MIGAFGDRGKPGRRSFAEHSVKALSVALLVLLLVLGSALSSGSGFWQYIDEIGFSILAVLLVCKLLLKGCSRQTVIVVFALFAITCIGLFGNVRSGVQGNAIAIALDWVSCLKTPVSFLAVYELLSKRQAEEVVDLLVPFAKIMVIAATLFGVISMFANLGMTGEPRFGIKSFFFIFKHQHVLAIVLISSMLMIACRYEDRRMILRFYLPVCCVLVLTTKGPSLIWIAVSLFLIMLADGKFKLKPWHIILIALIAIILGGYQIQSYLLNPTSPRSLLVKGGLETAGAYFPFGAGFGTYGSEMASRYYSPLYVKYGFINVWGMTPDGGMFLNDNYWPTVLGQFGYIGLALFILIYVLNISIIQKGGSGRFTRPLIISNSIYIMIHSLGSASITGAEGMLLFVVMAFCARASLLGESIGNGV